MHPVIVSPTAINDLADLATYLFELASLETALRFQRAASNSIAAIGLTPGLGATWESLNSKLIDLRVRSVDGFPAHLIFYRTNDDRVEIVRVLHGSRDVESILARQI